MKTLNRRKAWLSALASLVLVAIGWLTLYVISGVSDAIRVNESVLKSLRKEWLLDGSPENAPIEQYVVRWTDPERFFVWTNAYVINGEAYQSLFGMNDPKFEGKGILVVSEKGELIWVSSTKPPKVLDPKR